MKGMTALMCTVLAVVTTACGDTGTSRERELTKGSAEEVYDAGYGRVAAIVERGDDGTLYVCLIGLIADSMPPHCGAVLGRPMNPPLSGPEASRLDKAMPRSVATVDVTVERVDDGTWKLLAFEVLDTFELDESTTTAPPPITSASTTEPPS